MKLFDLDKTIEQLRKKNHSVEVLNVVKSGKEATVYRIAFDGVNAALKLYKNHEMRSFKNTDPYIAGKYIRKPSLRKAVSMKNKVGRDFVQKGWVKREYYMLDKLFDAGCNIPKPMEFATNGLVMEYIGEPNLPASPIRSVDLEASEAKRIFDLIVKNISIFLENGIIHSDLSEYNILYWEGKTYIIDFPQSVNIKENPNSEELLKRDVHNVCKFFSKFTPVDETPTEQRLLNDLKSYQLL